MFIFECWYRRRCANAEISNCLFCHRVFYKINQVRYYTFFAMVKNYLFLQEEQSKKRGKAGKVKRIICLNFSNIKMHCVKSVEIRVFGHFSRSDDTQKYEQKQIIKTSRQEEASIKSWESLHQRSYETHWRIMPLFAMVKNLLFLQEEKINRKRGSQKAGKIKRIICPFFPH